MESETTTTPTPDQLRDAIGSDPDAPETPAAPETNGAPPTPQAELPDDDVLLDDDDQLLLLLGEHELGKKVGGRKPDSSSLTVKGGKIDLDGQFNRGDRIVAIVQLQVTGDNDQDTIETASGHVKSTKKTQNATICGIGRLEEFLAMKLDDHPEVLDQLRDLLDLEN